MTSSVRELVGSSRRAWEWWHSGGYEIGFVAVFVVAIGSLVVLGDFGDAKELTNIAIFALGLLWIVERVEPVANWLSDQWETRR